VEARAKVDSEEYDRIANVCVMRATTALDTSAGAYNERHRYHFATIFKAMSGTHRTVRMMIEKSAGASDAVDVLAVTRLQPSQGGTLGTSIASTVLRGVRIGTRIPTPVGTPGTSSFYWGATADLGGVAARYLPYVGTAVGAAAAYACLSSK
jgi:hypothetical protein